jgi:tripartite-type tricarboxylate transporter receptor subunit TctC
MCPSVATAISHIESQSVKAVAILTKDRSPILPTLVSAREEGLTNLDAVSWYAFFLPKGTPAPIVQKLHDATVTTMNTPAVQRRLLEIGETVVASERRSPDYLAKFVTTEIEKWATPIKASGISMD